MTSLSSSYLTLHRPVLRQAKETEKPHSTKASRPADGAAKAVPSGVKHADRDGARKADGKAAAAKHSADARPQKAPAAAKKESAAAAKANGKEEKANGRVVVKKERKVFELPGQTRETPPEVSCCGLSLLFTSTPLQAPGRGARTMWPTLSVRCLAFPTSHLHDSASPIPSHHRCDDCLSTVK